MGNKRKFGDGKGKLRVKPLKQDGSADVSEDLDGDCVHYSSSENEIDPQSVPKRQKPTSKQPASDHQPINDGDAEGDEIDGSDGYSGDSDEGEESDQADELELKEGDNSESDVDVTLEFFDPRPEDSTSVCAFLSPLSRILQRNDKTSSLDVLELADTICAQTRVGTMVRVGEDEAPVGFISCLNVRRHAKLLSRVRTVIEQGSEKDSSITRLLSTCFEGRGRFEREKMGLVLCYRVVNFPPQVVPKLLEALFSEISWAVEDEPTSELREEYRFGWYLYITEGLFQSSGDASKLLETTSRSLDQDAEDIKFVKVEDEVWWSLATHRVCWTIVGDKIGEGGLLRRGIAMIVSAANVSKIQSKVADMVGFREEGDQPQEENET